MYFTRKILKNEVTAMSRDVISRSKFTTGYSHIRTTN